MSKNQFVKVTSRPGAEWTDNLYPKNCTLSSPAS